MPYELYLTEIYTLNFEYQNATKYVRFSIYGLQKHLINKFMSAA